MSVVTRHHMNLYKIHISKTSWKTAVKINCGQTFATSVQDAKNYTFHSQNHRKYNLKSSKLYQKKEVIYVQKGHTYVWKQESFYFVW